jgi:NhaP-type Na+/H+ or K+/H+ antiporter
MSPFTLIIGILVLGMIIYVVRRITRARGISRATKILLPASIIISLPGIALLFTHYIEIGSALIGLAGAMTLLEGYLRHRSKPNTIPKDNE